MSSVKPAPRSSFNSSFAFWSVFSTAFIFFSEFLHFLWLQSTKAECTLPAHAAELCGNNSNLTSHAHTHSPFPLQFHQHIFYSRNNLICHISSVSPLDVQKDFHCQSFQKHLCTESIKLPKVHVVMQNDPMNICFLFRLGLQTTKVVIID